MNSKEIVTRAIEFRKPERLPMWFKEFGIEDYTGVGLKMNLFGDLTKKEALDEWGCLWARTGSDNVGQCKGHPLADWAAFEHYRFPDPDDKKYYEGMGKQFEGTGEKYIIWGFQSVLFERMHFIRGFENVLTDLYLERENIEVLADRIV